MYETDNDRIISFVVSVDGESVQKLGGRLKELVEKDKKKWITLHISSEGGSPTAAFGLYEYVTTILRPKLQTVVLGSVASSALLLFLMGDYRVIGSYASLYLHEFGRSWDGPIRLSCSDLERILEDIKRDHERYAEIVNRHTDGKVSKEKMEEMMRLSACLSPAEAVELGFAHEILKKE